MLVDGEIDLTASLISATSDRERYIDLSVGVHSFKNNLVTKLHSEKTTRYAETRRLSTYTRKCP